MKTGIILKIIIIILVTINLKSEDNKYDIYSKGINYVLHKDKTIFDSTYLNNLCISESDTMGIDFMADLQKRHYKKIMKFSKDLAYSFKRNKIFETGLKDSFRLDFPYIFLSEAKSKEYFSYENNQYKDWDSFSEYYKNGALLIVCEIIYNKRQDKAAYFMFFISATKTGGRLYLVLSEKKNNIWNIHKAELLGLLH